MAILQMKISLKGVSPPVWRRILVEDNITFDKLHNIIQIVMNWENSHIYAFFVHGLQIGMPENAYESDIDSTRATLSKYLNAEKQTFKYVYDFSNCHDHKITIEKILEKDPSAKYPSCIGGKRTSPPEICEDLFANESFSEAADDQNQEDETDKTTDCTEDEFDPEKFDKSDIDYINKEISELQ